MVTTPQPQPTQQQAPPKDQQGKQQQPKQSPPSKPPSGKSGGKKGQNPHKVDTIPGFIILIGFGIFLMLIAGMNAEPYGEFMYEQIQGLWFIGQILSWPIVRNFTRFIAYMFGVCGFIGIQMGEVWPLMLKGSKAETDHATWHLKMMGTCILAAICYVIDVIACLTFWPPLNVPLEMFRFAGLWSQVAWNHVVIVILTLIGLSLYVILWRFVRRIA